MRRTWYWYWLAMVLCGSVPSLGATAQQVDDAVGNGVKYIYSRQGPDGTWEQCFPPKQYGEQYGGFTSMCVYTLLTAGESEKDPRLAKAIAYVIKIQPVGTYALGFKCLAMSKLTLTPAIRESIKKSAERLIEGMERPDLVGLWTYVYDAHSGWDHSNTQYGALGLWACSEAGLEIPDKIWSDMEKGWRDRANPDGGWSYNGHENRPQDSTISMTAAGIATLFITDDELSWRHAGDCKGNVFDSDIEKGLKWIIPHVKDEFGSYAWYGIERIGMASGFKYLGDVDWFKKGADFFVKSQRADGHFDSPHGFGPDVNSCYSILFLSRGRAPVVMNKLRYDADPTVADPVDGTWNQRSRDAAGAAEFVGGQLEKFMNWQVITLAIDPDDMHDAPILYISGANALKFTPAQEAKLKKFIEDGGMVLGNADCGASAFSESFRNLFQKLLDDKYEFRTLPATHPMFVREQFPYGKWRTKPTVLGMSNGDRELALLIPTSDPAMAWQMHEMKSKREDFELISDIYLYSVDREDIAEKNQTTIVVPDKTIVATKTVKLARLQYDGNWDPEPGGWRRLAAILHNNQKIDLTVDAVTLGAGKLKGYSIAHLTGTDAFKLDDAGRNEIKDFVNGGGTLVIDAAGGSAAFADSAQEELKAIFGPAAEQLADPIPGSDAFYADVKDMEIRYRSFFRATNSARGPLLRGIKIGNRVAVIFSREDLSAGLVGQSVDGILGYEPETAVGLMGMIVAREAR